jgi:hypothetical protein
MYSEILYHGTRHKDKLLREGFNNNMFWKGMGRMKYGVGFYATSNIKYAGIFGEVIKVLVTLEKPCMNYPQRFPGKRKHERDTNILKSEGYDGVIVKEEVCVFDAKNIKVCSQ